MVGSNKPSGQPPPGYEEVLHWVINQQAGRILLVNLLSIPLAVVFGAVFLIFVILFGDPPEVVPITLPGLSILLIGILLVLVIHELTHGVAIRLFGAKPKYGVIWKGLLFYATAPGYAFRRNQFIVVSLAPLAALSILACLAILLQSGTSAIWLWAIWGTINAASSIGDLWITAIALRYPQHAYVIDERDGIRVFLPQREEKK